MVPPTRQQVLAAGLAALLLLAGIGLATRTGDGSNAPGRDGATTGPVFESSARDDDYAEALVDVAGAVRSPGVYRIPAGGRVLDAIERAGGVTAKADLSSVNRAAPVVDGQQVVVPTMVEAPTTSGSGTNASPEAPARAGGMVSLNSADVAALDGLDGIGPITAQKIVADREANGPFASVDELDRVPGIGPSTVEALRSSVTL